MNYSEERADRIRSVIKEVSQSCLNGQVLDIDEVMAIHAELMPELSTHLRSLSLVMRSQQLLATLPTRYRLEQFLGSGSYGRVWKAWDNQRGMYVAIKFPKSDSPIARKRLREELQHAAKLMADEIVWVLDVNFNNTDDQSPIDYIVLRYIEGQTLREWLASHEEQGLPLSGSDLEVRLRMAIRIVSAVRFAHGSEIIHRDIKLDNILIDADHRTYLNDFGLAQTEHLQNTELAGTLAYMAPEQIAFVKKIRRRHWSSVSSYAEEGMQNRATIASDIYALGIVLYELVTHTRPFQGSKSQLLHQVQFVEPTRPSQINRAIDADLDEIILRCLAKNPGERYQQAGELAEELERWLRGDEVCARPRSRMEKCRRWIHSHPWLTTSGLTCSVLVVVLYMAYLYQGQVNTLISSKNIELAESIVAVEHARQKSVDSLTRVHLDRVEQMVEANDPSMALVHLVAAGTLAEESQTRRINRMLSILLYYSSELKDCAWTPELKSVHYNPTGVVVVGASENALSFLTVNKIQEEKFPQLSLPDSAQTNHQIASGFLSPAARYAVMRCTKGGVHVCRMNDRHFLALRHIHSVVTDALISEEDRALAVGLADGRVLLWPDLSTAEQEAPKVLQHPLPVITLDFAAGGKRLAVGFGSSERPGGGCTVWDVQDARALGTNDSAGDDVLKLTFSRSGRWLAFGAWNGDSGLLRGEDAGSTGGRGLRMGQTITALEFSPNEAELASASANGSVTITDLFGPYATVTQLRHENDIASMCYLPNNVLITHGLDRRIKAWLPGRLTSAYTTLSSCQELQTIEGYGRDVLALDKTGILKHWKLRGQFPFRRVAVIEGEIIRKLSKNRLIVTSGTHKRGDPPGGVIFGIDALTGEVFDKCFDLQDAIQDVLSSTDSDTFAVLTEDGKCRAWRVAEKFVELSLKQPVEAMKLVGFLNDRLMLIGKDQQLYAWDFATNELSSHLSQTVKYPELARAQHGALFIVSDAGDAELWGNEKDVLLAKAKLPASLLSFGVPARVAISPERQYVCISSGNQAWLWTVGKQVQTLKTLHTNAIQAMAFSPDSKRLVLASRDHTASLWDTAEARLITTLKCSDEVNQVAFSNAGDLIATGDGSSASGKYGNARLWDVQTGCLVAVFPHGNDVYDLAFTAQDDSLWTASWDGYATRWLLPTIQLSRQDWRDLSLCMYGEFKSTNEVIKAKPQEVLEAWNRVRDKTSGLGLMLESGAKAREFRAR